MREVPFVPRADDLALAMKSSRPILFCFALHRRGCRVFHLEPIRTAGPTCAMSAGPSPRQAARHIDCRSYSVIGRPSISTARGQHHSRSSSPLTSWPSWAMKQRSACRCRRPSRPLLPNLTIRSCFRGLRAGSRRVEVLGANEIVQKMNEIGHRLQ